IVGDGLEEALPDTGLRPVAETREYAVPVPQRGRQITPGAAGSGDPKDRLNKPSIVFAAAAGIASLPKAQRLHLRPLGVSQTNRSIPSLNHNQARMRIPSPNRP